MKLEDKTRIELLTIIKKKGIQNYHKWNKSKLIRELNRLETQEGTDVPEEVTEIINDLLLDVQEEPQEETSTTEALALKKLTPQAEKWKRYFIKINIDPKDFLRRYPEHKFKIFIEELV